MGNLRFNNANLMTTVNAAQATIGTLRTEVATANNALATAQTALTNLQQQQAQQQPQVAGAAIGATQTIVFATTPAMAGHEQLIDYKSKAGIQIYDKGCAALTTPFDMKSNGTVIYITEFQAKCAKMGWSTGTQHQITTFSNSANPPVDINVIDHYGKIDVDTLKTASEVFCKAGGTLYQMRARQNNEMMGNCILVSLTPAACVRLLPFRTEYEINGKVCAPLLHKKIMALATIDSVATTKTL